MARRPVSPVWDWPVATGLPQAGVSRRFHARCPQSPPVPFPPDQPPKIVRGQKDAEEHAVFGAPSRQVQHRIVNDPMPNHSRGRFRQDIGRGHATAIDVSASPNPLHAPTWFGDNRTNGGRAVASVTVRRLLSLLTRRTDRNACPCNAQVPWKLLPECRQGPVHRHR